jgi:4-hydroxymandelate oxidase
MDPSQLMTLRDYETAFERSASEAAAAFVSTGASEGVALQANLEAFDGLQLLPRALVDVSRRSIGTTLLGHALSMPVLIAPTAFHRLAHPDGELATVRAAGSVGTVMVLSLSSSFPVESVLAEASGPVWFQTYVSKDRPRTAAVIGRAESAGCKALVLTVDVPVTGGRVPARRMGFSAPPEWIAEGHTKMYGLPDRRTDGSLLAAHDMWDASFSWDDLDWLRGTTNMALVLKGVMRADDASRAIGAGIDAVIVSNHGGRQLDAAAATIEVLPSIADTVAGRIPVLVDGGIRRGSDIVKAIASGADAVLLGRPILWGLAIAGQGGVEAIMRLLADELDLTMALCGAPDLSAITPDLLHRRGNPAQRTASAG